MPINPLYRPHIVQVAMALAVSYIVALIAALIFDLPAIWMLMIALWVFVLSLAINAIRAWASIVALFHLTWGHTQALESADDKLRTLVHSHTRNVAGDVVPVFPALTKLCDCEDCRKQMEQAKKDYIESESNGVRVRT